MKVGVIGAGIVGSSAADPVVLLGQAKSSSLTVNEKLARAQAENILHPSRATHFKPADTFFEHNTAACFPITRRTLPR